MDIILYDDSPMPFGVHQGKPMEKVPAVYLLDLKLKGCGDASVLAYIDDNLDVLKMELQKARAFTVKKPQMYAFE